ncbi:uncharacterized protein LOC134531287 [Bacillus rossius redtenbacheri]|uniref:uncharacterized protein LOC134531287 n=1 Tax=Bacillus rossius redtenbacheri TaxID=93214 RepID=UPI002FDDCF67
MTSQQTSAACQHRHRLARPDPPRHPTYQQPLRRVESHLPALHGWSGYWQVPVKPEDHPKTAFTAPDGCRFQFCAMPFGLMDAPTMFQTMMAHVLDGYVGEFVTAYLDDVIVCYKSWEDHTDACKVGMGAVLYQVSPDGERSVSEYASSKFWPAARKNDLN